MIIRVLSKSQGQSHRDTMKKAEVRVTQFLEGGHKSRSAGSF